MAGRLLSDAFRDLRHTARALARSPVPSVAAILALALGLGATTTMWSVIRGVLLSPLPYLQPERLVVLWEAQRERGLTESRVAPAQVVDLRESKIFESIAAWTPAKLALTGSGEPLEVHALRITPSFFPTLGIQVTEGRGFRDEEATPGKLRRRHPERRPVASTLRRRPRRAGQDDDPRRPTLRGDRRRLEAGGALRRRRSLDPTAEPRTWTPSVEASSAPAPMG